jgi:hypothetical protein
MPMPSRARQRATVRLATWLVIVGLCIFAGSRGWSTAHFAIVRTTLATNQDNVGAVRSWIGAPGLAAAAMRSSLTQMRDVADLDGAGKRADELAALVAIRPLSSGDWLSLAEMQLAAGQSRTDILAALRMSELAGPNEGSLMWQRGAFGLMIWELLPLDARRQAVDDISGAVAGTPIGNTDLAPANQILTAKSSETKEEITGLIRGKGVSAVQLARLGLGAP